MKSPSRIETVLAVAIIVGTTVSIFFSIYYCPVLAGPVTKSGKTTVVCNLRTISNGEKILESNLQYKAVTVLSGPSKPIPRKEYIIERLAEKKFPAGHIFMLHEFGLPEKKWPVGNSLVVCAVRDIKKDAKIKISDIAQERWNGQSYLQGAFSDLNLVLNRRAKCGIAKGQILIEPDVGLGIDYEIRKARQKLQKH